MKRRLLHIARVAVLLAIVVIVAAWCLSLVWTGGVYGRDGDLLLGIYPGQIRIGWSQDWRNEGKWAHIQIARSSQPLRLGVQGGNTFTAAAPFEVAVDVPGWLILVPLALLLALCQRRIRKLPREPVCSRCGYPVGTSAICTECGASHRRHVSVNIE